MKNKSWYRILSAVSVMALAFAFVMATSGCSQQCGTCPDNQKCAGKCEGKCATPCKNADGSVKCPKDCKKPCCADKDTTAMNTKCPISGKPVDESVTATCCGKTVAFCCPGCVGKWNKLSEKEKCEKYAAVN